MKGMFNLAKVTLMTLALNLNKVTVYGAESTLPKNQDHCTALVLGGGGARGAYEAGVLWGFLHNTEDKSKYAYDVISGVSAGSINGAAISIFESGDEELAFDVLSQVY